ncbi:oxygen-independent coproporphyrinogen III oxidase [Tsuneonella suprasediminis]|uniref:oxygen-independent coproporphyrinogen III oxidase n=1 Tax=Tsuneonella suprasediminis TaxID=2306996 RepID=UPI002F95C3D2
MYWPHYPELLATPVPRYTSFPTAAEFRPGIGPADMAEAISNTRGEISLYVHIPFCEKICWYCGCNTAAANRAQRLASYMEALHAEIALVGTMLPAGVRIARIAFGGGSPNALAPAQFEHLFAQLRDHLSLVADPVVSIELDPRSLTDDWGDTLRHIGATHASLGVQTFAPHLQEAIGRVQPQETISRSVELLRDAGITSLNFDLMYGLPGQTWDDLAESLALTVQHHADRIALFGYAHVPHMLPRQRRIDDSQLPGQEPRFHMAERGYAFLTGAGYRAVGFDHFALPGDPLARAAEEGWLHRNFQGFTDDTSEVLLGIGASAISSFPGLLAQNEKNTGRYRMMLSQGRHPATLGVHRSTADMRRGDAIVALLCHGRADVGGLLDPDTRERLEPFLVRDLARIEGRTLTIADHAVPYARSIAAVFDPYRIASTRKFSTAI